MLTEDKRSIVLKLDGVAVLIAGLDVSLLGRDSGDFQGTLGTFVTLDTFLL